MGWLYKVGYIHIYLKGFTVRKDILTAVYRSLIETVLTFNIASWYNFLTVKSKKKLTRIIKHATKITGTTQTQLSDLYSHAVKRKAEPIRTLHTPFITPFSYFHKAASSEHLWPKRELTKTLSFQLQYPF